jgi:hypothetical protein
MINLLTNEEFGNWITSLGLVFRKARVPASLEYHHCLGTVRTWAVPEYSRECLTFVNWALAGLAPWSSCVLWPFAGQWPGGAAGCAGEARLPGVGLDSTTWKLILRGVGMPDGWEGAVRMGWEAADRVKVVAFTYVALGSSSQDDLFLIPDHGNQFVHMDPWGDDPRDEELRLTTWKVHFSAVELADQYARHMARVSVGSLLPQEGPSDGTTERLNSL